MRLKITLLLSYCIFIMGCTQQPVQMNLPTGITLLSEVDSAGLDFPIWSPDGKYIVAAYNIMPMPDFCFGCSKPRSEMVLIDPQTGNISTLLQDNFNVFLTAFAWAQDSKSIAIYYWDDTHGHGIFTTTIDKPNPKFLVPIGTLSPDWEKVALSDNNTLKIINVKSKEEQTIEFPETGDWDIGAWSTDGKQMTFTYRKNKDDRFESIYLLELTSQVFSQFSNDSDYYKTSPTFSYNGEMIAYRIMRFIENGIESKVVISRLDQSCKWIIPLDNLDYFTWSPDNKKTFLIGTDGVYIADLEEVFGENFVSDIGCP